MKRSRRLLCVYQHAPTPGAPGIYRHRLYLSKLVERGWDVDLVSTPVNYMTGEVPEPYRGRRYVRETIDGITHHWVWASGEIHRSKRHRVSNYASFATAAALRSATLPRPDVIMVSSPPLTVAALGPLLAKRFRRPYVLEVRDIWPESASSVGWISEGSRLYRALDRLARSCTASAAATVVPTFGLVGPILGHGAHTVRAVPGSVIEAHAAPGAREALRGDLGIGDGCCLFAYVGAVGVANGVDRMLDALRQVPSELDVHVVVAGSGSALEELQQRMAAAPDPRVSLLGAVPKGRVVEILAGADVGLHLLRPDPLFATALPSKVLEYLGARLPFVTTVPGLPERLAHRSQGGFASSVDGLAAEMTRWAGLTPDERRARGEAAYRFGMERFGVEVSVDALETLLEQCIDQRGPVVGDARPIDRPRG